MEYDEFITHKIDIIFGKPKSGKTLFAGSYPKPMLYISVGNDGGGKVLLTAYRQDCLNGNIKVKNLTNDKPIGGKIAKTSAEKLAELFAELRKPGADKFKTIVIDTIGAIQDDYKAFLEFHKRGVSLSQQEWGDVSKVMLNTKDNLKRFSQESDIQMVWIFHSSEQEVYETSGLNKEIRIIPDVTIKTGVKFMKEATNIFYCCRKTILNNDGSKTVKFLTYAGPHPLMDTGTRDIILAEGGFVENLTYEKWQHIINVGRLDAANVFVAEDSAKEDNNNELEGE